MRAKRIAELVCLLLFWTVVAIIGAVSVRISLSQSAQTAERGK